MSDEDFYNLLYLTEPDKWTSSIRDILAFSTLSKYAREPATLLDVGCGNGHTIKYFMERWPSTVFTGLDFSEVAIEIARKKAPGANFVCGPLEEMQIRSHVITCMGVAEHFEDLQASLKVIKKYGYLFYLECPNCLAYSESKAEGFRKTHQGADQEEWHLTRASWEQEILEAGFEIREAITGPVPSCEFIWVLR